MADVEPSEEWSDVQDALETESQAPMQRPLGITEEPVGLEGQREGLTIISKKAVAEHSRSSSADAQATLDRPHMDGLDPRRQHDASSVHSLPAVHVTEPASPVEPHSAVPALTSNPNPPRDPPASPARPPRSSHREPQARIQRRRSTIEGRGSGSNRFSEFLSSFMHRREAPSSNLPRNNARDARRGDGSESNQPSRTSSPTPPGQTTTPPPSLPGPSLKDLGLILSTVTSDLSPSHFSTPPTNGAFLAPHYLLLCHAQGLDVVPLTYPPAPQPYALVRRVSFKSVVVMEHRGVLVAIAGRRDGVRVYALEEVKKAVEWRIDVEVRREKERKRREDAKRATQMAKMDTNLQERKSVAEEKLHNRLPPSLKEKTSKSALSQKSSFDSSAPPQIPRPPVLTKPKIPAKSPSRPSVIPNEPPPAYSDSESAPATAPSLPAPAATVPSSSLSVSQNVNKMRRGSIGDVLQGTARRDDDPSAPVLEAEKPDWAESRNSSDEEAIDVVAAGASGSQALDERTSAIAALASQGGNVPTPDPPPTAQSMRRNNRPANLDLGRAQNGASNVPGPHPSPAPTLVTLRQALAQSPAGTMRNNLPTLNSLSAQLATMGEDAGTPVAEAEPDLDEEDEPTGERITLAQMLMESRLPDLPPAGTRQPQRAVMINSHSVAAPDDEAPASPRSSDAHSYAAQSVSRRRRRRWSVLDGIFTGPPQASQDADNPGTQMATPRGPTVIPPTPISPTAPASSAVVNAPPLQRISSRATSAPGQVTPAQGRLSSMRSGASASVEALPLSTAAANATATVTAAPPASRLFSRIISSALHPRRSDDNAAAAALRASEDTQRKASNTTAAQAPAPKLEYVKLPGTKGAVMIKAVETAKKSFLAILCGDSGEKVELFAGTYRTALGLSRTFILPDSPRSLELQLQGDDLVEVFLVFSQNVFGLEPATVRVREVRIGRAERRAARRRAREHRTGQSEGDPVGPAEEETDVNVSIGVNVGTPTAGVDGQILPDGPTEVPSRPTDGADTPNEAAVTTTITTTSTDNLIAVATAQMGPFTTFQQLSFAPRFPLAAIADDYIIPPTYPSFLQYRKQHENDENGDNEADLAQIQFTPPGLPLPTPTEPSRWYYRDPKGVVHGPWKAKLMESWYKDGLLPPDLPVRREEDATYVLLKELRQQSVDPAHPFRPAPPPLAIAATLPLTQDAAKPLLPPMSLLAQPRHFGPPALFFSSRGGHSTTIVDARGRSVIKGRFMWSSDDADGELAGGRLGDVRRLEAFDVKDRSVLVAMRHGGLEAVDLADALLKPADESRPVLPYFNPPDTNTNRRRPFVWKIGTPLASQAGVGHSVKTRASGQGSTKMTRPRSAPGKSPGRGDFYAAADSDVEYQQDEVFFIGRNEDAVYICERRGASFRVLRLSPDVS